MQLNRLFNGLRVFRPKFFHKNLTSTTLFANNKTTFQGSANNLIENKFRNNKNAHMATIQTRFSSQYSGLHIKEVTIPVPWGSVKAQIFGEITPNKTPILTVHGYLDNSNSFKPLAAHICRDEYYIISMDLPGHGLSSGLPLGIPYTPKLFLNSIRRVVKYFELEKFIFMTHSYGTTMALLYDTVFQGELKAIVGIDWIFGYSARKWSSYSFYWKEGIDTYLNYEKASLVPKIEHQAVSSAVAHGDQLEQKKRPPLTPELAVKILMKANNHLDETSAKILLERALVKDENGNYKFSRDLNVKNTMSIRDHYLDFVVLFPEVKKYLAAPSLMIHANPPSYGKQSLDDTLGLIDQINSDSKTKVKKLVFEGTHHFHMINPRETSVMILEFLDSLKTNPSTKL